MDTVDILEDSGTLTSAWSSGSTVGAAGVEVVGAAVVVAISAAVVAEAAASISSSRSSSVQLLERTCSQSSPIFTTSLQNAVNNKDFFFRFLFSNFT